MCQLCLQCTGLVQFATEDGRRAALLLNKSSLMGQEIAVTPSRFSLIPVAAATSPPAGPSSTAATNSASVAADKAHVHSTAGSHAAERRSNEAPGQQRASEPRQPSASLAK
jgi:hypothetical protein